MRKLSPEERHKAIGKLVYPAASVLIFTLYVVFTFNNAKGRSYIYEPVYISLEGIIPESTNLELSYQTFNDPTIVKKISPFTIDSIPLTTYIFKIDSTFRLINFSIYLRSLKVDEEIIISSIKASNEDLTEYSFSLKNKDLILSEDLAAEELGHGAVRIIKVPHDKPNVSFLHFYARNLNQAVLLKTSARESVFPSMLALAILVILGVCLYLCLYPLLSRLNWNGISLGTYLLAAGILIMPSGEKVINLILGLAILAGLIREFRQSSLRKWIYQNRIVLLTILSLVFIYLIAFLSDSKNPSTHKLLKIKFGLPMILLALAVNTNYKRDIRIHCATLLSGVVLSVFMHLGWTVLLVDGVEIKSKVLSNPQYFMESAVYSRIHHSYLSILYLASLAIMFLKRDIIGLRRYELVIFSLLIITGLIFAFSRSAILSLLFILVFFSLKWIVSLLKIEISHVSRLVVAVGLSLSLLFLVFADLKMDPATDNVAIKGLSLRMDIWAKAGDLIRQKPITGWGPGNYKYALMESNKSASFNRNQWSVLNTHNQFLETAGMFGLPAALALVWFLMFPTGFSRQAARFSDFILTAAIIIGTAFAFESVLNRNLGVLVFGLCYGLLIKIRTIHDR